MRIRWWVGVTVFLLMVSGPLFSADAPSKVVVIGFDGADAALVEQWMDAGELPNLARLRDEGSYSPLLPTNPPQTPVSWSSFATGLDPGGTAIFDFLKRNPDDYLPDFAMNSETRKTFLFGEDNALYLGAMGGVAVAILVLIVAMLLRKRKMGLVVAVVLGVAAGIGLGAVSRTYLPREVPTAINNRQGDTFWKLASDAGKRATIIRVPATFPADPLDDGAMLSGLGVPDMRGRIGTPSFYTSDRRYDPGDNEFSLELIALPARRGSIETRLVGPLNKPFYEYEVDRMTAAASPEELSDARRDARLELDDRGIKSRLDLPLTIEATDSTVTVELGGRRETLQVGEWSEWFELDFPVNALVDRLSPLTGLGKFKLLQLEPELELYFSPLNFHPDCHAIEFASPPSFSEDLHDRYGLYKTIGWALDTWSLPSGFGDEALFLEDMEQTVTQYEKMMEGMLASRDQDLYVQIFNFTDRIGHLFWQFMDPGHPLFDPVRSERWRGEMLKAYKRMDDIVGRARELAGDEALFIVCSDHGFSTFRRGVNYNNWLVDQGLLVLKDQPTDKATLEKLFETRDLFTHVDWDQTKAYALGLGSIYINRVGRERNGTVLPGPEYDAVVQQIKEGLEGLVDEATGLKPVANVWTREEMYGDFDPRLIPDLRVSNTEGYRVSWQTSLGGFGAELIEDNTKAWSGDHCSLEPELVQGILFSNRPLRLDSPTMVDLMPTILEALGVAAPANIDGESML